MDSWTRKQTGNLVLFDGLDGSTGLQSLGSSRQGKVPGGLRPTASDWIRFFQIGVFWKLNPPPNHLIIHFH